MTKTFRIALIMPSCQDWTGGVEYIRNIILASSSLPREIREAVEISLIINRRTNKEFVVSVRPYLNEVYNLDEQGQLHFGILHQIKEFILRRVSESTAYGRYDAILKKNNIDFAYPCVSSNGGFRLKKAAAWIYDFQHKYLPELFSEQEIKQRDRDFSQIARHASLVILSSKSAESDFKKFYPEEGFKAKVLSFKTMPLSQWYNENPLDIQKKYNLPDKFFIISNQFWQHKNHLAVFNALKLMKDKGINPVVVCTGHIEDYRKPEYSDLILQTVHKLGLAQQVLLLGLIPKIDQIQLLRRSVAIIQPSLFEGWSTVIEEARCLGKPIILSDFPVHLEQNPPGSHFFERTSSEALAQTMMDLWETLSPGPDPELESIARAANKAEIVEFAKNFLTIAKSS